MYTDYYKSFILPERIAIIKVEHDGENDDVIFYILLCCNLAFTYTQYRITASS